MQLSARQREGLVQAAKAAVAAAVAFLVARQVHAPQSFMAPYAAVFMMTETVYRSFTEAARTVATLVLGVLLAFVTITVIPNTAVALPVAVFVGAAIGRWHRLGDSGIWIGVTALLMLAYGTADDMGYLVYRAIEGVLGAAVGLAVNMFVVPPLHLRSGPGAVEDVAAELDELVRDIATGLRGDWDDGDARGWQRRARELEDVVRRAEQASGRTWESTRYNPRWVLRQRRRPDLDGLHQDLGTLYEIARQVQHITEALVASSTGVAPIAGEWFTSSYADLLDALAKAVAAHRDDARSPDTGDVARALDRSREWRRDLVHDGIVDGDGVRLDWSTQAALLLAVERACDVVLDGDR
ncbi:aromatic acid exporter family protein [Actinophytocola sp. NPDC049390]|uniref:aromatic acid exporter family protein n=1 Tax=Actinophytocola sp. NPDC049390 TaxID=3363894 RepID=UPI00378D265E